MSQKEPFRFRFDHLSALISANSPTDLSHVFSSVTEQCSKLSQLRLLLGEAVDGAAFGDEVATINTHELVFQEAFTQNAMA